MARIRTVKPEFFKHYDLFQAEVESCLPLRLAFQGLWIVSDREGRFKWAPQALKLDALPYDEVDFSAVLDALEHFGFIIKYQVDNKIYGYIPSFTEHQRITGSEASSESKIPCPPNSCEKGSTEEILRNTEETSRTHGREGKGKGKEMEGKGIPENQNFIFDGKNTIHFSLGAIYHKSWDEYSLILNGQAAKLSEIIFMKWKEFIDFIIANEYTDLFQAKFVTPIDFGILLTKHKFLEAKWKDVIERMLSSGVTPAQNLFFRIPQFLNYSNGKEQPKSSTSDIGKSLEFDRP
jgi:hypothetical protein